MASQHHFTDRVRAQLNDANARNLELQALLAQRDDTLAACNARLQNVLSATSTSGGPDTILLQNELRLAKEATTNAEIRLNQAYGIFNKDQSSWKQRIESLQREVAERDTVLGEANYCLQKAANSSATIEGLQAELANTQAELARMKQYASGVQRQYEVEKRENTRRSDFPTTAAGKRRTDVDEDDEELFDNDMLIKQEAMAIARRQRPGAQSTIKRRERQTSHLGSSRATLDLPYRSITNKAHKSSHNSGRMPQPRKQRPRRKPAKRRQSSLEDEDADYTDLDIDMDDSGGRSITSRTKSRAETRGREIEHIKETLSFKAIISYDDNGDKSYLDSKQDLADECPELWERIQVVHEGWEQLRGEHWQSVLEANFSPSALAKPGAKPPCVSTKLLKISGGRSTWREGFEGKFACRGCAEEKRPCFSWDGEELFLLPLHAKDRTFPLEEGFEIRTWVDIE